MAMQNSGNNSKMSSRRAAVAGASSASDQTDFDPDRSNRETRKLARKVYTE
jgi:hypothetical protein